jgi:hypothetical protein
VDPLRELCKGFVFAGGQGAELAMQGPNEDKQDKVAAKTAQNCILSPCSLYLSGFQSNLPLETSGEP